MKPIFYFLIYYFICLIFWGLSVLYMKIKKPNAYKVLSDNKIILIMLSVLSFITTPLFIFIYLFSDEDGDFKKDK